MSERLVEKVFSITSIKGTAKSVLFYLAYRANDKGQAASGIKQIAQDLGIGRSTLFTNLKSLEEKGLISIEYKRGKGGSNTYHLNLINTKPPKREQQRELFTPEPKPKPKKKGAGKPHWFDQWFEEDFWKPYPPTRKKGKKQCKDKLLSRALKSKDPQAFCRQVVEGLKAWKGSEDWKRDGGQFVPGPIPWINQEAWEEPPRSKPSRGEEGSAEQDFRPPEEQLKELKEKKARGEHAPDWKIQGLEELIKNMKQGVI